MLKFYSRKGVQGLISIFRGRKIFLGFLLVPAALLLAALTFRGPAGAAQLEDVCRSRCQAMADEYKKEKGVPLPSGVFKSCVEFCMNPPQIKSEADIPDFCRSRCEQLLKNMNPGANPASMKECADRCVDQVTRKFRQSRIQGQKNNEKKQ
jgi:hypothetical protein